MTYLRELRLALAHDQLTSSDPRTVSVAGIAYRTGFAHLGRFAAAYRNRYGVPPSRTLHHESTMTKSISRRAR
jgi:transcriptional regulator GlxA family with amidase domain